MGFLQPPKDFTFGSPGTGGEIITHAASPEGEIAF